MASDAQEPLSQTTDLGPIPRDQWDHFQQLSEEHHHQQRAEIENLKAELAAFSKALSKAEFEVIAQAKEIERLRIALADIRLENQP